MAVQAILAARILEISEVEVNVAGGFSGDVVRVRCQFVGSANSGAFPVTGKHRGDFWIYVAAATVQSLNLVHGKTLDLQLAW